MLENFFSVFGRIIIIVPLLLLVTLFMGRRSLGQLPVFDFVIIITIGNLVGADLANPSVNQMPTVFGVIIIGLFQKLIAIVTIKNKGIGKRITLEPIVAIVNGNLIIDNLKKVQYTIDNILLMLRQKDIFDINDVELAVIEANGELSVLKKPEKSLPLNEDLGITQKGSGVAYPIIIDGVIQEEVLNELKVTKETLRKRLLAKGIVRIEEVFLCTLNKQGDLHLAYTKQSEEAKLTHH